MGRGHDPGHSSVCRLAPDGGPGPPVSVARPLPGCVAGASRPPHGNLRERECPPRRPLLEGLPRLTPWRAPRRPISADALHPSGLPLGSMKHGPQARPTPTLYGYFRRAHVCRLVRCLVRTCKQGPLVSVACPLPGCGAGASRARVRVLRTLLPGSSCTLVAPCRAVSFARPRCGRNLFAS